MLKEPALKAAKVIKEAWTVKIFSLSSCRDALILHGQKLRSLGCCITCLHLLRPIEAEHTLLIFFTFSRVPSLCDSAVFKEKGKTQWLGYYRAGK